MRRQYRILKTKEGFQLETSRTFLFGISSVWYLVANEDCVCEVFPTIDALTSKYSSLLRGHVLPIIEAIDMIDMEP